MEKLYTLITANLSMKGDLMNRYAKLYLASAAFYVVGVSASYLVASSPACCKDDNQPVVPQQKENRKMNTNQQTNNQCAMPTVTASHNYGHIDAKTLKNLVDTSTSMLILDARTQKWDDGRRVPGAVSLPADSSLETIRGAAPHKEALIVIYCGAYECPASKILAEKMVDAGYRHILEYAGGMKEWADVLNYPIEKR